MNNQPIGARCQVCRSKRRHDGESFVNQGMSNAQAARAIGVNAQAMSRHMKDHAAPGPEATPDVPVLEGPAEQRLEIIGLELAKMLKNRPSATQRLQILSEQRRLAESQLRAFGPPPSRSVTVNEVDGLNELFARFHAALVPWPEARAALAQIYKDYAIEVKGTSAQTH